MALTHNSTLADNEPSWGSVDKTALPRMAHADMGEVDQKSTWGYPHHWVEGGTEKDGMGCWMNGTMYLHEGGLNAAWAAANGARSGQEASQAVKDHLQAHRDAIGARDESQDKVIPLRGYSMKSKATKAEITIYEEIGEWFGGLSAKKFSEDLKKLGQLEEIMLRINSPGGDVFDGLTIHNLLKQNSARVIVYVDGLAASIASVIAMAGDEIYMAENALMMVHNAWGISMGNAADMRKMAEDLDKVDDTIITTYMRRTQQDKQLIKELMRNETTMSAKEAQDYGFIDGSVESLDLAACVKFDLSKFNFKKYPPGYRVPMQPGVPEPDIQEPMPPADVSFYDDIIGEVRAKISKIDHIRR